MQNYVIRMSFKQETGYCTGKYSKMKPLVCCLVVTLIQNYAGASTLRCYSCESCGDPFDKSNILNVTCSGSCHKSNKKGCISRGCSNITLVSDCSHDEQLEVCACDTYLCNKTQGKHKYLVGLYIASIICFLLQTFDRYHN